MDISTSSETSSLPSPPTLDLSFSHVDERLVEGVLATLDLARPSTWEPLHVLQHIERLHRQESTTAELADGYQKLGKAYRDRFKQGQTSLLEIHATVGAYDRALEYLMEAAAPSPEQTGEIAAELGVLYAMLSRGSVDPQQKCRYLQQSREFYRVVLEQIEPQHRLWMQAQHHLGEVYADLARYEDATDNLEKSAIALEAVLRSPSARGDRDRYAATQNSLGTTYWSLAQHREPVRHLQQAIAAYDRALEIYTPQKQAIDYAMVHNNLGTAYLTLSKHERTGDNLLLAVAAYRQALDYRTPETQPIGCAATQNNLAAAYWHLARQAEADGEKAAYLQQAIAAYETAVTVAESVGEQGLPFDRFAAHNNLGLAHYQWVTHSHFDGNAESRQHHLEAALHHHLVALDGWQEQPERYQAVLDSIVRTIRAFYNEGNVRGQNWAFSQLPARVLPKVMERL